MIRTIPASGGEHLFRPVSKARPIGFALPTRARWSRASSEYPAAPPMPSCSEAPDQRPGQPVDVQADPCGAITRPTVQGAWQIRKAPATLSGDEERERSYEGSPRERDISHDRDGLVTTPPLPPWGASWGHHGDEGGGVGELGPSPDESLSEVRTLERAHPEIDPPPLK
jgi:hypothetical protein